MVGPNDPNYSLSLTNSINKNLWPSSLLFNGSWSYNLVDENHRKLQVYGNIENILDKSPPIVAITSQGPYDLIGRAFKFGLRFSY